MRNVWLIIRREYLERVRTKSFVITTILLPTLMFAMVVLPSKLMLMKSGGVKQIAIIASSRQLGDEVAKQLTAGKEQSYKVDVQTDPTDDLRTHLRNDVSAGKLDGYLWLTNDALAARSVTFYGRSNNMMEDAGLHSAVSTAYTRWRLAQRGVPQAEIDDVLKPINLDSVKIEAGKETKSSSVVMFFTSFVLAMMLYVTLLLYGMAVMRSVLEEKTSRVMEVMLASVTPKELMAGKILGVGAVGVTQMLIWAAFGILVSSPALMAGKSAGMSISLSPVLMLSFAAFFLMGYLLYSAMYAALGAAVNSEQEAQQWQFFVTLPIIVPIIVMSFVISQPSSPMAVWLSMVPFFAPILMYVRLVAQAVPAWQVALCVTILMTTVYGALLICSRIYRVGILMYGKRPTLPEIVKWLRYA